jgi:hypothetical protein
VVTPPCPTSRKSTVTIPSRTTQFGKLVHQFVATGAVAISSRYRPDYCEVALVREFEELEAATEWGTDARDAAFRRRQSHAKPQPRANMSSHAAARRTYACGPTARDSLLVWEGRPCRHGEPSTPNRLNKNIPLAMVFQAPTAAPPPTPAPAPTTDDTPMAPAQVVPPPAPRTGKGGRPALPVGIHGIVRTYWVTSQAYAVLDGAAVARCPDVNLPLLPTHCRASHRASR